MLEGRNRSSSQSESGSPQGFNTARARCGPDEVCIGGYKYRSNHPCLRQAYFFWGVFGFFFRVGFFGGCWFFFFFFWGFYSDHTQTLLRVALDENPLLPDHFFRPKSRSAVRLFPCGFVVKFSCGVVSTMHPNVPSVVLFSYPRTTSFFFFFQY